MTSSDGVSSTVVGRNCDTCSASCLYLPRTRRCAPPIHLLPCTNCELQRGARVACEHSLAQTMNYNCFPSTRTSVYPFMLTRGHWGVLGVVADVTGLHHTYNTVGCVFAGRIEFVDNGWSQHDMGCTTLDSMVSNWVEGHQWLLQKFGPVSF